MLFFIRQRVASNRVGRLNEFTVCSGCAVVLNDATENCSSYTAGSLTSTSRDEQQFFFWCFIFNVQQLYGINFVPINNVQQPFSNSGLYTDTQQPFSNSEPYTDTCTSILFTACVSCSPLCWQCPGHYLPVTSSGVLCSNKVYFLELKKCHVCVICQSIN